MTALLVAAAQLSEDGDGNSLNLDRIAIGLAGSLLILAALWAFDYFFPERSGSAED